jgi:hypothetical protein
LLKELGRTTYSDEEESNFPTSQLNIDLNMTSLLKGSVDNSGSSEELNVEDEEPYLLSIKNVASNRNSQTDNIIPSFSKAALDSKSSSQSSI